MRNALIAALMLALFPPLVGEEVLVTTKDGRSFWLVLDLEKERPGHEGIVWGSDADRKHGQFLGTPRDYYAQVEPNEKEDIRYIITVLANKSLFSLPKYRPFLEAAGDRIDHLHPLNFLLVVFLDEELKVGIRNIRARGWVWGDFLSGLKESLATEFSIHNIFDEYICDFASQLEISVDKIYPLICQQRWDEFIDTLIREVPRKGGSRRYDS